MKLTSLCYIERGGEYLMLHRVTKKNDCNQDKWIGVGGKFEADESPFECVRREALEETGLHLEEPRFRGIVTFVSDKWETEYMHLFTCSRFSGEEHPCSEGVLEWIPKNRLQELTLWDGDLIFLRMLEEDRPFFDLKLVYEGEKLVSAMLDGEELK
ncbi:MAG: NUDIX hydrolase [Candidatus Heteroscillospira sp.]